MERFNDFIKERQYLMNVSPKTLRWYMNCFASWRRYGGSDPKEWVIKMRESGVSPISIDTYICGLNAYWKWAGDNIKLAYLKEEQKILATLSADQIKRIIAFKPSGRCANMRRVHLVALTILRYRPAGNRGTGIDRRWCGLR